VPEARCGATPVVAAAATPDGGGYWLTTSAGHVNGFRATARNRGSIRSQISGHVISIVATTDGKGYWLASSTGGVFNFGDALFYRFGEKPTQRACPIVAMGGDRPTTAGTGSPDANGTVFQLRRRSAPGELPGG